MASTISSGSSTVSALISSTSPFTDHYANPLYLPPGDNISAPIVTLKLTNENYHIWSRSFSVALSIKNKMQFIDGTLPMPEATDPNYSAWNRCNFAVLSWILNSVSEDIAQSLISYDKASLAWKDLKQRFSQCDAIRIADLQSRIAACDQGEYTVTQYFTNLKVLWEEYLQYRPIPVCDCNPGRLEQCSVVAKVLMYQEQDYVIRFIRGLNDSFDVVRSQLLLMDPLPDINTVFKSAVQMERQMRGSVVRSVESVALATNFQNRGKEVVTKGLFCRYCKKDNHMIEDCYRLKNKKAKEATAGGSRSGFAGAVSSDVGGMITEYRPATAERSVMASSSLTADDVARLKLLLQQSVTTVSPVAETYANLITSTLPSTSSTSGIFALSLFPSHSDLRNFWIIDTGASSHVACHSGFFSEMHPLTNVHVTLPTGSRVQATHCGSVPLSCGLILKNVLLVPHFSFNLLSVSQLTNDSSLTVTFSSSQCLIQDHQSMKMIGSASINRAVTLNLESHKLDIWHCRLGHPSLPRMQLVHRLASEVVLPSSTHCHTCHLAKQKTLPFQRSTSRASFPFELVHMDIWGPLSSVSYDGYSYFLTVLDDFSRCVWVFLMKNKSETRSLVQSFCAMVQTQFSSRVQTIRSDQGQEFRMDSFFSLHGIQHQTSCVSIAQQNGRVERKHQHLLAVARSLRFQSGLSLRFWGACVLHACYLINRLPTPVLQNKSPFEVLYKKPPTYNHLRVFGCLAYASTLQHGRTKFAARALPCVFIGYQPGIKGYKLVDLQSHKVLFSRNVIFHETILPYKPPDSVLSDVNESTPISLPLHTLDNLAPDVTYESNPNVDHIDSAFQEEDIPENQSDHNEIDLSVPVLRRSNRISKPPSYLKDYHCALLSTGHPIHDNALFPLHHYISYHNLSPSQQHFSLSISVEPEPQTYWEAVRSENWKQAMNDELQALVSNGTWVITELPAGKRAIGCKWVYRVKYKADGSVERYKARLVAKGYTQVYGVDFTDTFSPVAKINSVKTLLAVAAVKQWHMHQMDVSNAFLHGDLEEEVYMELPQGVKEEVNGNGKQVCKLLKSLYGLKQASRRWFVKLTTALKSEGFHQSNSDHSLFIYTTDRDMIVLLVYVDDIILAGSNEGLIEKIKSRLHTHFKIKDLGKLKYFLGLEVARSREGINVCQRKYCLELIEESGMLHKKPSKIPCDYKLKLRADEGQEITDIQLYRQLVGKLHYLTITRPDISYAVQQLAQFQAKPTDIHLEAAYKVIRYLKMAPGQGLFFSADSSLQLVGYSDSDWASCPDSRRSTSGYCLFLGTSLISWKTKKQSTVSRSSSEAEYRALAHLCCEVQWLTSLLLDLGVSQSEPTQLFCDNQSAIHIAQNPVFHERTKHIEIDCHVVRERLLSGLVRLNYVPTEIQLADLFTKGLPAARLRLLLSKLGIQNIYSPACGGLLGTEPGHADAVNVNKEELDDC
ncbi:Retrovirus-related Pol polyprotein from transposon TNT 1-94 [Linum perenne]